MKKQKKDSAMAIVRDLAKLKVIQVWSSVGIDRECIYEPSVLNNVMAGKLVQRARDLHRAERKRKEGKP